LNRLPTSRGTTEINADISVMTDQFDSVRSKIHYENQQLKDSIVKGEIEFETQ
jgi:hypothetical protein